MFRVQAAFGNKNHTVHLRSFCKRFSTQRFGIKQTRTEAKHSIAMYEADPFFLCDKIQRIARHTWTNFPNAPLSRVKIEMIDSSDSLAKADLIYKACLDGVLPPLVKALYGEHKANFIGANCHGAALVATGLFPAISYLKSPFDLQIVSEKSDAIPLEELQCGDLIFLDKEGASCHSFVFLDHELSYSMNGAYQPFLLHNTTSVLQEYAYPIDCLKKPAQAEYPIVILRKKREWNYPEKALSYITVFYDLVRQIKSFRYPGDLNITKMKECALFFQSYALQPELAPSERQAASRIFHMITTFVMPNGIIDCTVVPRI